MNPFLKHKYILISENVNVCFCLNIYSKMLTKDDMFCDFKQLCN